LQYIPPSIAFDTNPKRQRGSHLIPSLALRAGVENLISGRGQYLSAGEHVRCGRHALHYGHSWMPAGADFQDCPAGSRL